MHKLRYLGRLLGEIWRYAAAHKAWWIVPLVVVLLLLGLLVLAGQTVAPFIYTVF